MKNIFIPVLLFHVLAISGQNLIPNPGFELIDACPENSGLITLAVPWSNPNLKSPDLYHVCVGTDCEAPPFVCVPNNWVGSQSPFSGDAYAGIFVGGGNENREYIQVPLLEALSAGQAYVLTYQLSLADGYEHAIDRMGVHFSPNAIFEEVQLNYLPQLTTPDGVFLTNKAGWTTITDTLIASGGEAFLTIGNFNDEADVNFIAEQGGGRASAYYYLDGFQLVPATLDTLVTPVQDQACDIYFPNVFSPNHDGINDEFSPFFDCVFDTYQFVIFNRWGARIFETLSAGDAWDGTFQGREMPSGVYLYQLRFSSEETGRSTAFGEFTLLR